MLKESSVGLGLPKYSATERQKKWVADKARTARLIRSLWGAADTEQRRDPRFLCLLVQCGWTNTGRNNKGRESTRRWRNKKLAEYLNVSYRSDEQLAVALSTNLPSLKQEAARHLLKAQTGITHYYTAFRPATLRFVKTNANQVHSAFKRLTAKTSHVEKKISDVAVLVEKLGDIRAANRKISAFNGLTPVLACLDPQHRFPIMNDRTRTLLRVIHERPNADGIIALYDLIGRKGIRNSLELDAYAYGEDFSKVKKQPAKAKPRANKTTTDFADVGYKSEVNSFATISAKTAVITKRHNQLTNRFSRVLKWNQLKAKEYRFDALIKNWTNGRDLLVEAKTASVGPAGRTQIRQAIGQLYDYRFTHLPREKIDLAVLLPKRPQADVQNLLASLHIEVLWFEGKKLGGTIHLADS
jgi:hypothetical protein